MKFRFLLILVELALWCGTVSSASAKPPCILTDTDYAALAKAKRGPLDRAAVDALSATASDNLCRARALVVKLHSLGAKDGVVPSEAEAVRIAAKISPDEIPIGASKYVTAAEYGFVDAVGVAVLARELEEKGLLHPGGQ